MLCIFIIIVLTLTCLDLELLECFVSTLFFQSTLYVISRLAKNGFTLGELVVTTAFGTALFMEVFNLTKSKVYITFQLLTYYLNFKK